MSTVVPPQWPARSYGVWLLGLLLLFLFRVVAQFVQWLAPLTVLPSFETWQSGALPYSALVASQLVILAAEGRVVWAFLTGSVVPSAKTGRLLLAVGWVYFAVMGLRLLAGLTIAPTHFWFGAIVPTLFHLVLAAFVLVWGSFHAKHGGRLSSHAGAPAGVPAFIRYAAYPAVLLSCLVGNMLFVQQGAGILLATYVPVTAGTLVIMALERLLPYRREWRPSRHEVVQDSTYLALVHALLPKALGAASVFLLFEWSHGRDWAMASWWPKEWPVLAQTVLMVLIVDGLRYWLHRLSHEWEPLWRFHAVHHAPQRLYTLNVGRFHPIDKALQFVFDALPFIALGVQEEVMSLYFVWYAVNGFFQHSNVDVRLGYLNYLVSGPELHRWHHSVHTQESNHNYGNHLILWDVVFRSRYLPTERTVGALGLINRAYPEGIAQQMRAPFIPGLDKRAV